MRLLSRAVGPLLLCALVLCTGVRAADRPAIAFVPLDDRPVTEQLPRALGAVAGVDVLEPPQSAIGNYLSPGDPEAIARWLRSDATSSAFAAVLSTDMLAYGGLVASRTPATDGMTARIRLDELRLLRAARPVLPVLAFGTVMRLAPTGLPKLGAAANFFAAGPVSDLIAKYANLSDPPVSASDRAEAERLRSAIGSPLLAAYLQTRARNRAVDAFVLALASEGTVDRVLMGQDDAGPQGLHLRDLAELRRDATRFGLGSRAAIQPGADELGMIMVARALADRAAWKPKIAVRYSRAGGGTVQDPLEFAPVDSTVGRVIAAAGGTRVDAGAEIELFVRVAGTSAADEAAFVDAIAAAIAAKHSVAVADLTFLGGSGAEQRALVEAMIARKIAGSIDAFASWNTTANTVGTAIPLAIAAGVGRRSGGYDLRAHREFLLDRYADDYAFHDFVRPAINDLLSAQGVDDHTFLLPEVAQRTQSENRSRLWPLALDLLHQIFPGEADRGLTISLPWDRTFETKLDVRVNP
jgi:hypothetical protein